MSACCYGPTHIRGKDRRQALAMLLGGALPGVIVYKRKQLRGATT